MSSGDTLGKKTTIGLSKVCVGKCYAQISDLCTSWTQNVFFNLLTMAFAVLIYITEKIAVMICMKKGKGKDKGSNKLGLVCRYWHSKYFSWNNLARAVYLKSYLRVCCWRFLLHNILKKNTGGGGSEGLVKLTLSRAVGNIV